MWNWKSAFVVVALSPLLTGQSLVLGAPLQPGARAMGDVDADARGDYMVFAGADLQILSGATGAVLPYLTRPSTGIGWGGQYTPVGDVNADGHDDLGYYLQGSSVTNFVEIVSGANGAPLWSWNLQGPIVRGGLDADSDGFDDVCLDHTAGGNRVAELRSGRTGAVLLQQSSSSNQPFFLPAGDANGDGHADLAAVASAGSSVLAILRLGPTLTPSGLFGDRFQPVGDVNGNGTTDYFHAALVAGSGIVDGSGPLLFSSAVPFGYALGDVDGDGFDDVFLETQPPVVGPDLVLSGATLQAMPGYQPDGFYLPVGDIDGDGRVELATRDPQLQWFVHEWSDPALPNASRLAKRGRPGTTSLGTRPRIHVRGSCALGRTVFFDVRGGLPSGFTFLVIGPSTNVDLTALGAPGNVAYVDPIGGVAMAADAFGLAVASFLMPVSPSLLGATTSVQAFVLDATANALGLVVSDAVDARTQN